MNTSESKKTKKSCKILSQECIGTDIYSMWLDAGEIGKNAVPGQFVSLYSRNGSKLLPRPISLCEIDKEEKESISDRRRNRNPADAGNCKTAGCREDHGSRIQG